MNVLKRAILYIARSWKKTLIMFFLLLTVSVLVLSGLAISDAQENKTTELKGTTGTSFSVERNLSSGSWNTGGGGSYSTQEYLTDEMVKTIGQTEGIKGYNASRRTILCFSDENGTPLEKMNPQGFSAADCQFYVYGCENAEYNSLFLNGTLQLVEGEFISSDTKQGVVISKDIAEKHNLKIGDRIQAINDPYSDDPTLKLEIIGTYEITVDKTDERNNYSEASYYDYTEYAFIDMASMRELLINYEDGKNCDTADFFVSNPEELEKVIQEVQKISTINWDNFLITANDEIYERVAGSVSDISLLMTAFIVIVIVVSMVIVVLILSTWIKNRKREIGIFLAVGISRTAILIQYLLETIMVAVLAFPLSYYLSNLFASNVGTLFDENLGNIVVTGEHFKIVFMVGILLVCVAVLLSCIPVMKYKPKELLSQME